VNTSVANIFVVDDTPANPTRLCGLLREQGYRVRPAPSGTLALKTAVAELPDPILLDISMHDMDGFEVCARVNAALAAISYRVVAGIRGLACSGLPCRPRWASGCTSRARGDVSGVGAPEDATDRHDPSVMLAGNGHRGWHVCHCKDLSSLDPSEPPIPLTSGRRPS
jgi:hypothetical protein